MSNLAPVPTRPEAELHVTGPDCIMIELTNLCNLRCTTCPRNDSYGEEMGKGLMRFEHVTRIVDDVSRYASRLVLIGLGETLLYRRLLDVVEYIARARGDTQLELTTNATLPNGPSVLQAVCATLPTSITFSIDGVGATYDVIRRGGSYTAFVQNVSDTVHAARASTFAFNMVVCEGNYSDMTGVLELAHSLGIQNVHFNTLNLAALPAVPLTVYDFYRSRRFRDALDAARAAARRLGVTLTTFDFERPAGFQKCRYPWEDFYITWDGFLVLCCAQPFPLRKHFGNVLDAGVLACINSAEFQRVRRMWRENTTPGLCMRCHKIRIPSGHPAGGAEARLRSLPVHPSGAVGG